MAAKTITAFITKYALTGGIKEETGTIEGGRFVPADRQGYYFRTFTLGKEAFESKDDAVADAKKRVAKKVKSLEKQIVALNALKF